MWFFASFCAYSQGEDSELTLTSEVIIPIQAYRGNTIPLPPELAKFKINDIGEADPPSSGAEQTESFEITRRASLISDIINLDVFCRFLCIR